MGSRNLNKLRHIVKNGSKADHCIHVWAYESLICKSLGPLHIPTYARKLFLVLSKIDMHCCHDNFLGSLGVMRSETIVSSWMVENMHTRLFSLYIFNWRPSFHSHLLYFYQHGERGGQGLWYRSGPPNLSYIINFT